MPWEGEIPVEIRTVDTHPNTLPAPASPALPFPTINPSTENVNTSEEESASKPRRLGRRCVVTVWLVMAEKLETTLRSIKKVLVKEIILHLANT